MRRILFAQSVVLIVAGCACAAYPDASNERIKLFLWVSGVGIFALAAAAHVLKRRPD
jgi:hypothetical protein